MLSIAKFLHFQKANMDEFIYILCGLIALNAAIRALRNKEGRIGTFVFWLCTAVLFAGGKFIVEGFEYGAAFIGCLLVLMGILTLTNQVKIGEFTPRTPEETRANADRIGYKIFIPALVLGLTAFALASLSRFKIPVDVDPETGKDIILSLSSPQTLGLSSLIALIVVWILCKPRVDQTVEDMAQVLMEVGPASLLPQLLAGLGVIFATAGVGDVIGQWFGAAVPEGSRIAGAIAYVLGMMLFTMIMGNAFAAFTVMTVGIGIPFLINLGANPAMVGALGMTAGYCGTLLTPMAANFNIVPVSILGAKDKYTVIKAQAPVAIAMALIHIVLILVLAF